MYCLWLKKCRGYLKNDLMEMNKFLSISNRIKSGGVLFLRQAQLRYSFAGHAEVYFLSGYILFP